MCKRQVEIYSKDADYLGRIKDKLKLRSRAAVLELIIKKIKYLKVEGELR